MATYNELQQRINELKARTGKGSISPRETFELMDELLEKTKSVDMTAQPLVVTKSYNTLALANADKNPINPATNKPLALGQLVSVVADGANNAVYRLASLAADGSPTWEKQAELGDMTEYAKQNDLVQLAGEKAEAGSPFVTKNTLLRNTGNVEQTTYNISTTPLLSLYSSERLYGRAWSDANTVVPLAFYDANKVFIEALTSENVGYVNFDYKPDTWPAGSAYVRACENDSQANGFIKGIAAIAEIANLHVITERKVDKVNGERLLKDDEAKKILHGEFALKAASSEEYLLLVGYGVNHSNSETNGNLFSNADYTTAICKTNGEREYYVIGGKPSWYALYSDYPFINSNLLYMSPTMTTGEVSIDAHTNAKYLAIHFRNSENTTYENLKVAKLHKKEDLTSIFRDRGKDDFLSPNEIFENKIIKSDGTMWDSSHLNVMKFEINPSELYFLKIKYRPAFYGFFALIYFSQTGQKIGHEGVVKAEGVNFFDGYLHPPLGAAYVLINTLVTGGEFELKKLTQKLIDVNEMHLSARGYRLKVVFDSSSTFYVRQKYNEIEDLIIRMNYFSENENNANITPFATHKGLSILSDNEIISSQEIHITWDSTAPLMFREYWAIGAQHGYAIPRIDAVHDKTSADVGSLWTDNLGRKYMLGKVEGGFLYFLPSITINTPKGKDTREWRVGADSNDIVSFTHVSGAINQSDIDNISNKVLYQVKPIHNRVKRNFFADGVEVTDFKMPIYCDKFIASETLECINPTKVIDWFPKIVHASENWRLFTMVESFIFSNLGFTVNSSIKADYPLNVTRYSGNQARTLVPVEAGDTSYAVIPKVTPKQFGGVLTDFSKPFETSNWQTNSGVYFYRSEADLADVDDMPDRIISYLKDSNGKYKLGFASGYSLTRGSTRKNIRKTLLSAGDEVLLFSPENRNKFYVRAINTSIFADKMFPENYVLEVNYYFQYFDPTRHPVTVYAIDENSFYTVYIHGDGNIRTGTNVVELPDYLEGCSFEVVEKNNANLITETISNQTIYISFDDSAGYIVLKTPK